jgi:hypothetical protein
MVTSSNPGRDEVGEDPVLHGALDDETQQSDVERAVVDRGAGRVRPGVQAIGSTRHTHPLTKVRLSNENDTRRVIHSL